MKKLFSLIAAILILSCSTSSDDNGNSTTAVVPVPPTNLIGTVASPTQINLSWTDNSTNETGFKIERRTGTTNYSVVGTVNQDLLNFSDSGLTPSTTYTYRVYAFNAVGNSLTYTNEVTLTSTAILVLPTLTTTAVSSITQSTAVSGGTISNDGGAAITSRGVCWSSSPSPTISLTTRTTDGAGAGVFTSNITGLVANTSYYVRAYATNSQGTDYGNEITFTTFGIDNDNDGFSEGEGDCNDNNSSIYPGANEILNDGIDNNCNGITDENNLSVINNILNSGTWRIAQFQNSGIIETNNYLNYIFTFVGSSGIITAQNTTTTYNGTWSVTSGSPVENPVSDFYLNINFAAINPLIDPLTDDWQIVSYTDNLIQLVDVSSATGVTKYLTFQKN